MAIGSEHHTFHVHGHRWRTAAGVPEDTRTLGPAESFRVSLARGRARHVAVPLPRGAAHGEGHDRHLPGVPMRRALAGVGSSLAATLAAPAAADATSVFVFAQTQAFSPAHARTCCRATRSIWRNTSSKTHNVKFETEGYNSGRFGPGEVRNHPFPTAGVYDYHCTIHTGMIGQVGVYPLVLEGPADAGSPRPVDRVRRPRAGRRRRRDDRGRLRRRLRPGGRDDAGRARAGPRGARRPGRAARRRGRHGQRHLSRRLLGRREQRGCAWRSRTRRTSPPP